MIPIPLAYSTNGFTTRSLSSALTEIHQAGYHSVELLGDRPHWSPRSLKNWLYESDFQVQTSEMIHLKSLIRDLDLSISNINGNTAMFFWPKWLPEVSFEPSLNHPDRTMRSARIDSCFALFDWALELGAPRVSVTSGRCPGTLPPEDEYKIFKDSIWTLCERAASMDLQLSIEYEPGLLIERWSELRQLLDDLNHPVLGANLDLGHAQCAGEDPIEAIEGLRGKIWNVHIEDIKRQKHYHLIPGEGDLPISDCIDALHRAEYNGALTVELYTYAGERDAQACKKAYQRLKKIGGDRVR